MLSYEETVEYLERHPEALAVWRMLARLNRRAVAVALAGEYTPQGGVLGEKPRQVAPPGDFCPLGVWVYEDSGDINRPSPTVRELDHYLEGRRGRADFDPDWYEHIAEVSSEFYIAFDRYGLDLGAVREQLMREGVLA